MYLPACLKLQGEFPAKDTAHAIEHSVKLRAVNVVLHIPGIEMVQQIENREPDPRLEMLVPKRQCNGSCDLKIERRESREVLRVPLADKVSLLIDQGIRKPGV